MIIHDESRVKEFLKMLEDLNSHHIEIGIFGDGLGGKPIDKDNPITVVEIATVHEFGTTIKFKTRDISVTIPERSFIRAGFDTNKVDIEREGEKLLEKVINLQLPVQVFLQTMGENIVGKIQKYLTDMTDPPLAEATIKAKGSSGVLIDTGKLRESITYKVVRS